MRAISITRKKTKTMYRIVHNKKPCKRPSSDPQGFTVYNVCGGLQYTAEDATSPFCLKPDFLHAL